MPELITTKDTRKPLRFSRLVPSQGLLFEAALPCRHPPNVRKHQVLQVLDATTRRPLLVNGQPRLYTYPALLDLTVGQEYETIVQEAAAGDADAEVLLVFFDFLSAVQQTFPMGLRELCSHFGTDVVASGAKLTEGQLTSRLRGVTRTTVDELCAIKEAFPEMDLQLAITELLSPE